MRQLRVYAFALLLAPAVALAATLAAPASAQLFSKGYQFLQAVRDRDGNKATELLNDNSAGTLVNTRDVGTGQTALHIAVARRDLVWVRFLAARGADANLADREGLTPLIIAAQIGFPDAVPLLIAAGGRVNQSNSRGETPLHFAVQRRDIATVRALIAAGADADVQDNVAGMSPRDYARNDNRAASILAALDERPAGAATTAGPRPQGPN